VPLSQLIEVKESRAPIEVVRVNQRPVSVVEGVVEEGGTARAAEAVRETMAALELPGTGVQWAVTGADADPGSAPARTSSSVATPMRT